MKRVKISIVLVILIIIATDYLINQVMLIGDHMTTLSQEIIIQAVNEESPEIINAGLNALSAQWTKYEPIAVALAGRNHADLIALALDKSMTFAYTQEDEDLILNLTDLISNIHSMCKTESLKLENFS